MKKHIQAPHLLAELAVLRHLPRAQRQPKQGPREGVPHVAAERHEGAALVGVPLQHGDGEVALEPRVAGVHRQVGAVGVEVDQVGARDE